nr:hypothetical protein [Tanacetum cinerariifolium]
DDANSVYDELRAVVHGVDDALDAQSGNGAKMFPKWIDRVGSKNGTTYRVGDVDEYVCQPNIKEPYAHNIPNVEIVQLVDLVKVQQVEHNLLKIEVNNLKNAQEAQSKKLDQVVKAQSSSEKRLRKFVAQKVGKVAANEVGKAVAEKVGKATQQILDAIQKSTRLKHKVAKTLFSCSDGIEIDSL